MTRDDVAAEATDRRFDQAGDGEESGFVLRVAQ